MLLVQNYYEVELWNWYFPYQGGIYTDYGRGIECSHMTDWNHLILVRSVTPYEIGKNIN
jgi:hypothetical protein